MAQANENGSPVKTACRLEKAPPAGGLPLWIKRPLVMLISVFIHAAFLIVLSLAYCGEEEARKTRDVFFDIAIKPGASIDRTDDTLVDEFEFRNRGIPQMTDFSEKPDIFVDWTERSSARNIPRGTSFDNLSNKNLNSDFCEDAYGSGPGSSGAYGRRWAHVAFLPQAEIRALTGKLDGAIAVAFARCALLSACEFIPGAFACAIACWKEFYREVAGVAEMRGIETNKP
jgi:hypothetical protein